MGNAEGTQQGKEPGNEPSDASGVSQQHVGSTSNGGSSPVSGGGVVDTASGGDFSISPGGAANVMEQLDSGELEEHPIEADLEADEKPEVHSDAGFSMPAVNSWLNDADEEIDGRVGVGMSEAGMMREPCLRSYGMVSNGDEEGDSERLEYERTVERMDSDSTLVTGSTWRDSIASTMTDVSEMYQTAGEEDSDNEAVYADEDNDGDDDDELRKTLIDSQLRENVADTTSIGYVSLTGDDKLSEMWEREQNAPLGNPAESEEMINVKGLRIKRDEKDDVETRKLEDAPSPPRQSSEVLDKIDETLKALGENAAAEESFQRVFSDDRQYDDDVEGSVDNGVKGFDAARDRLDPQHLELKNHIEFESGDYVDSGDNVDASKPDDDDEIVALQVSSVSLQLQSPVPDGNPKCTIKGSETGHTEQYLDNQEFPADHIARHHEEPETSDTETSETGAEAEEMSVVSPTEVAGTDPDYDVTAATGDDDDTPQISEHSVSSPISAYSSSVRVVLVSNTEGDDFQLDYLRERGVGSDIVKMEDELVLADDSNANNAHQFSLDEGSALGLGCNSFAHLSEEQKQVDASRSHAELSSDDGGMESSMPLDDEDITTSTAYSHEHEYSSPAVDRFIGVSPRAHETSSESKSHEAAFVSDAREQGLRTKTENDEELSAEQMAPDSGVGHGVETLSTGIRPEESEEEDAIRGSDRRSIGLIAMSTIDDDEDEAEAAGGTVSAAEHQSWSGGEDEPEPDYSLSSDDDQGDDTTQLDIKDLLITFDPSAMSSDSSEHQDTDVGGNAPLPEYQAEMHAFSMSSSTEPASATDPDEQSAEQISDNNNESADTRTDDFDSWEDDNDNDVPLGNFQRISSIRPSKRGRIKSKRSVVIPPSWSEHPEEEGEVSADTPGAESVFLPFVGETLTIPHPARYDRGPQSVPVSTKDHDKELWTKHSQDSSRSMTGGSDGNQSHRKGFLERRNATRTSKTEGSSDEKEWTKYEVVLRKSQGGFGITLSHSSPVVVFKVQEDGVAAKAGIREGDRIQKVNGTLVSNYSHDDVIKCIRSSGLFVILAIQRPSPEIKDHPVPVTPSSIADNTRLSRLNSKSSSSASTRSVGGVSLISSRMSSPPEITDLSHDTVPKPFTDLNFLRQKPAHLAVFLNYLLTEGKPNAMLFTLMADCYQNSIKDTNNSAKRWAYEIYSTFLTPSAPLKLTVDDGMGASVEKMLQRGATNGLLTLFVPITNLVRNDIASQLKQFVMFWKSERNSYASDYHLRMMNMDRQLEFQVIEGALWKHFEHCLSEERNDSKHAIAYSLATFFRQIGYSGAKNSNLLENCPTFMSKDKKALKNNMKKHFAHKGHQFTPRQFAAVTQCQLCRKVIWGLGHQAYYCSSCDLSIHRHCTEKIIDVCGRNKDSKRSMRDMIPGRRSQNSVKEELQKNFFLPPFMTDPDDLRNLPMTPVDYIVGSERERLQLPEFTAERSGRSPSRSYSRQVCSSDDSDLEVDSELPQLTDFIPKEELRQMKEKEKKRQQFINELFHTERLHLRVLKVMDKVFYRPMQEDCYIDQEFVSLLFPNLQDLIHIHDGFKKAFVALRKEKAVVDEVGLLLITKFSGSHGEKFKEACAKFCADQAYALNVLRTKQKKDPRYSSFLQEASANSLCKRLELKDFLPRQMQRLTKYPLLIDGLRKNTSPNTEEHGHLTKALELSKNLLQHVNQVVKVVQNQRHLADMQQRLDWRSGDANSLGDYKFLNLTKHSLVYDGEVTWRPYRSRPIELHMVLFEDILVLLQKQDDRLVLRYQMTTVEDTKFPYCPILKLNSLMIRDVATDKRAFFVVDSVSPQVYDLLAHSREEKNKWCNYILDTIKRYTGVHGPYKGGRNRSATQMIDLVSYSKSDGGQALAGDGDLPSNQASDARSVSCHVLQSYDSPDQSSTTPTTTGINVQQVISRLTTSESFGATKLSNTDECDNAAVKDDCGNSVEGPRSQPATFELERRLEELTLCINQLMREKLKLASEDPNISFGDEDDGQFQRNEAHTLDAKELVRTALTCVNSLMDLINDQLGNVASSPDLSSGAEERKIAIPAEDLLSISSTLQNLTAQLAVRVTTDDAELERLEEDFRVALDYLKERSSAIQFAAPPVDRHPNDDLTGSSSCSSSIIFGASAAAENAFFPTASQTNIYTAFNEDEPRTFYEHHDQRFSAHSDLLIEGNRSAVLIDEDSTV